MNKAKKIIIIVLSCVVVLGGIYFALRTLKQKNQNSKTAGVYAVSDIGLCRKDTVRIGDQGNGRSERESR